MAEAKILAADLTGKQMAACVQISSQGFSVYRWKGNVEQTEEYYLNIKTTSELRHDVIGWLKQRHPYELPEIVWAEYDATEAYSGWVNAEVS